MVKHPQYSQLRAIVMHNNACCGTGRSRYGYNCTSLPFFSLTGLTSGQADINININTGDLVFVHIHSWITVGVEIKVKDPVT